MNESKKEQVDGGVAIQDSSLRGVTLSVRILIRRTKYELIIKLITEAMTNLRDESIKSN